MAKIVIAPLEMANGTIVRNIEELKEHFDIEKVVGYFLDGKLQKWLQAKRYEEELEQVNELTGNDPELAKKLCAIFGVEYIADIEIDTEDIIERKERLSKLKQYTDDEEIIANVDSVAFNQEELADLYDKGIEKIYLCEGNFKIPKSKASLTYHIIGDIDVEGLEVKTDPENISDTISNYSYNSSSNIPLDLADYIGYKEYVELDDYIVWKDFSGNLSTYELNNRIKSFFKDKSIRNFKAEDRIKIWNKNTNDYSSLYSLGEYWPENLMPYKNSIIYRYLEKLYVFDLILQKRKCLYEKLPYLNKVFSVNDGKVAFIDDNAVLRVIDIKNEKFLLTEKLEPSIYGPNSIKFCLTENSIFYNEENTIMRYNLNDHTSNVVFEFNIPDKYMHIGIERFMSLILINNIICFDDRLYVTYWDRYDGKSKIIKVDLRIKQSISFDISEDSDFRFFENNTSKEQSRYLVFYNNKKINIFDMITNELKAYSGNYPLSFDQMHRVGDYLYWGFGKDTPSYRVNLNEEWNPVKIKRENSINKTTMKGNMFI